MAKIKSFYECSECGNQTSKWLGKCPECGSWNSFVEQQTAPAVTGGVGKNTVNLVGMSATPIKLDGISTTDEIRFKTGIGELDRVLGGGIVSGSLVLLGGDPGIGKSTLLLQICEHLGKQYSIMYVSGEESARQIKLRASRLSVSSDNLSILTNTDVHTISTTIITTRPDIVMIDSIQTMCMQEISSSAGSVTQVRESTNAFMRVAKGEGIPIIIVGHVNKDGAIAGPKVMEHIVDAVLYFEGERTNAYRILRAVKNRFGSTNEIGVFTMGDNGLSEVSNPSLMLLSGREENVSGSCVVGVMEGSRPILTEVQALVTKTGFGTPRRTATGFDYNRMNMLLAVLEKRAGYFFGALDVYINVVGGLKLDEPAADLSVSLALISSLRDKAIDSQTIAFGEIGLGGEIRTVANIVGRIKEALRLGFTTCIIPYSSVNTKELKSADLSDMNIIPVANIKQALSVIM